LSTKQSGLTIPIFPCKSIDEQLNFYQALGFEVTYRQSKPNLYACVRHPIMELHFFVLKQLEPSSSYSMCYVSVQDVDAVYEAFCQNLKKAYGKIHTRGLPRITKLNDLAEDRRFNLIDPAGNRLLIGQPHAPSVKIQQDLDVVVPASRFTNAFKTAYQLAYAKDEPADAARVLDLVFSKKEAASVMLRYQAYVLRADIAVLMDEIKLARAFIKEADQLPLSDQELEEVVEATKRLNELKADLEQSDLP